MCKLFAFIDLAELVPRQELMTLTAVLKILHAVDKKITDWNQVTGPITLRGTAGYHLPGRNINFIYADLLLYRNYPQAERARHLPLVTGSLTGDMP